MDLRRLQVFVKLMQTRSFSKAGQELNLTQPTISGHIKSLEQVIGLQLFDRHRRKVNPTAAAAVLLDYAERILELHREAGYALEKFRGRISGRLTVGGSTIPGSYILPAVMGRFHRLYEETYLNLVLDDTIGIVERVSEGDVEMGVVGARYEREDLSFDPLIEDQMVLAVAHDNPLGKKSGTIDMADLIREPFIIREDGSGTRTAMLSALAKLGVSVKDMNVVAEMSSTEAVRQTIKAGMGVSILSRIAVEEDMQAGSIRTIPIHGLELRRMFFLVLHQRRTRSPALGAFIEFLRAECRTWEGKSNG
jgi:DNA-binding transcriptional LysR family regulator